MTWKDYLIILLTVVIFTLLTSILSGTFCKCDCGRCDCEKWQKEMKLIPQLT